MELMEERMKMDTDGDGIIRIEILPFKCNVCRKRFNRKISLEHHMRGHTGERPFSCSYCPMAFRDSTRKRVHERVHTGERPYGCPYCSKAFATSSHLKNHVRCHTGEKPYRCSYPGCSKLFSTASSLSSHLRTHPPSLEPKNSKKISASRKSGVIAAALKKNGITYQLVPLPSDKYKIITKSGSQSTGSSTKTQLTSAKKKSLNYDYAAADVGTTKANSNSNGDSTLNQLTHPFLDVELLDGDGHRLAEEENGDDDEISSRLVIDEDYGRGAASKPEPNQLLFDLQQTPGDTSRAPKVKDKPHSDYNCQRCGETFQTYSSYHKHSQEHDEKPFPCSVCGDTFNSLQELTSHREVHSSVGKKRYCPFCNKPFAYSNKSAMDRHVDAHRKIHSVRFKPDRPQKKDGTSTAYPGADYLKVLRNGLSQSATVFKKLDCPYCSKIYIIEDDLKAHLQTHLPQPVTQVKHPSPIKKKQSSREKIPAGQKPFSCSMCPLKFRLQSTLVVHERRHRNESPYTCEYCKQQFGTPEDLQSHLRVHTPAAKQFKCTLCSKKFGLTSLLKRHMVVQHKITYNPPSSIASPTSAASQPKEVAQVTPKMKVLSPELNSEIEIIPIQPVQLPDRNQPSDSAGDPTPVATNGQSGSTFDSDSGLEILEVNLEEGVEREDDDGDGSVQYECPYCPKVCKQKTELRAHVRSHTGERPFGCDFCGKRFTQRGHLTMHIRIHTGEKPFRCPYCLREFNQHSNLKSHLEVHNKAHVHTCVFCNVSFGTLTKIRAHMLVHSTNAALLCQLCNRQFAQQSDLIEHMATHTNDKPFSCPICNKRFTRKTHLTIHERSHELDQESLFETVQIKIPKRTMYSCYHCGIGFQSVQELQAHALKHPEEERMSVFLGNGSAATTFHAS